jgi:hypothetical protein
MELAKAFSFVTDDDQWLATMLIGGLLLFVPIFGWLVLLGFTIETARNVMRRSERPLPRWDNLGEKFMLGLYSFAIQLAYALPAILITLALVCIMAFLAAGSSGSEEAIGGIIALVAICFVPLIGIVGIVLQPITWAAHARYLQSGSLSSAFQVAEVIAMTRANLGTWVIVWLLYILCGIIAQAGAIVFFIGLLLSVPYSQAVFGHILGQASAPRTPQPYGYTPPPATYQ